MHKRLSIRWLAVMLLCSATLAYDEQATLFAQGTGFNPSSVGYGIGLSTSIANQLAVGALFGVLDTDQTSSSAYLASAAKLTHSRQPDLAWYSLGQLQWQFNQRNVDAWFGLGIERELAPTLGILAEGLWHPWSSSFMARIGVRLWLGRFNSLDARVRTARPLGAVYLSTAEAPTPAATQTETAALEPKPAVEVAAPKPPAPTGQNIEPETEPETATATEPGTEPETATATETETMPPEITAEDKAVPSTEVAMPRTTEDRRYLQLGLFKQQASVQAVEEDARLNEYRELLITRFDRKANAYRLLLGPFTEQEARQMLLELSQRELSAFIMTE